MEMPPIVGDDNMPEAGDEDDDWEWQPDPRFDCSCPCIRCGPADKHDCGGLNCIPGAFILRND